MRDPPPDQYDDRNQGMISAVQISPLDPGACARIFLRSDSESGILLLVEQATIVLRSKAVSVAVCETRSWVRQLSSHSL
jgi:hypothetical protein